jgi:5-(carboxyamino)imidazole ribonucleotide synthase
MYNILGSKGFEGEYIPLDISNDKLFLKMYGKKISKPLRKLGHLNLVGSEGESIEQLLQKLDTLKEKTIVQSAD